MREQSESQRIRNRPAQRSTLAQPAASAQQGQPAEETALNSDAPIATPPDAPPREDQSTLGQLRHLSQGTLDRLTTFVSGKTEAPRLSRAAAHSSATDETTSSVSALSLNQSELKRALLSSRRAFLATGVFSFVINILMLAGPLFMLQVYDRVMTSGSLSTLTVLALMTAFAYIAIGMLELVRSRIIVRVGVDFDRGIGDRVFQASLRRALQSPGSSMHALRDLDSLRQFIAGPAPLTFFDAPWTPFYLLVIFMLHWTLGIAATIGGALLLATAWISEVRSRQSMTEAGKAVAKSLELAESGQRNAESITAMGMFGAYRARWQLANAEALAWQVLAADRLGTMSSLSKLLRLLLQSMMLAMGAALAIKGDISAGSIVASTILFGRALAPVEHAVGHWRSYIRARESYQKIESLLAAHPQPVERMALPAPKGRLEVSNLRVAAPESRTVILTNINFTLEPGKMLSIIGPSGSGKSTLTRAIVGLWEMFGGQVRLDGARLDQWNAEELGRHIGYLPQSVELFAGTVSENIARFIADANDEDIIAAAKAAHAHDMIMALPQSYETQLGAFGTFLSAGQRQRIGLARALFRNPALVVLDEPNSNLDRSGDEALSAAIDGMRARGQSVILVSHRVQAIGKADYLLYIERGTQRAFGPRAEVIRMLQSGGMNPAGEPTPAPSPTAQQHRGTSSAVSRS